MFLWIFPLFCLLDLQQLPKTDDVGNMFSVTEPAEQALTGCLMNPQNGGVRNEILIQDEPVDSEKFTAITTPASLLSEMSGATVQRLPFEPPSPPSTPPTITTPEPPYLAAITILAILAIAFWINRRIASFRRY